MTQYAIITDLNKCVGCLSCSVACKAVNEVPIGNFWNKVLRVGPNPKYEGAVVPDVEMCFLPITCQHCADAPCVSVCPTEASHKLADGTVQIDKEKCIGCQFCAMACPYGVRYLNEEERVVEKCTLCEQKTSQGELPQCVAQCGARARFFGDLEAGWDSFVAPGRVLEYEAEYDDVHNARVSMLECVRPFTEDQVYHLHNVGNNPSCSYILRDMTWQG
ncbi:MAG: 4Fe-4S dicluster domain-containing protein [Eggerthellaceae bacterium]|nr:4Fe-4S dicluster domain-containing protein [Eggerthellaceae bacterium]